MALDWENVLNFSNQTFPFENQIYPNHNYEDDFLLSLETELLCFDYPLFAPPPVHPNYHDYLNPIIDNHDLIMFNTPQLDFPPPVFGETEDYYSHTSESQFVPCSKKQRISLPCFDGGVQVGEKAVSKQSKAARERRRKITGKTQELGKLVPGGSKMNTAEMLQSAFKYVKFLQAQLGILQSMHTFMEKNDIKMNLDNLSILASDVVQEKLYTKDKCLIPEDFLSIFEENCNFDTTLTNPN